MRKSSERKAGGHLFRRKRVHKVRLPQLEQGLAEFTPIVLDAVTRLQAKNAFQTQGELVRAVLLQPELSGKLSVSHVQVILRRLQRAGVSIARNSGFAQKPLEVRAAALRHYQETKDAGGSYRATARKFFVSTATVKKWVAAER